MFNLTESFKQEYKEYLLEKSLKKDYEDSLTQYEEAQKYINEGFDIISQYFNTYSLLEGVDGKQREGGLGSQLDSKTNKELDQDISDVLMNTFNFVSKGEEPREQIDGYKPAVGLAVVRKISEMKFPENVIFFFQHLISWIVNLIKKFISFFTNAVRRLFGLPEGERFEDTIQLNFQKAKKIESVAMAVLDKDYMSKRKFPAAMQLIGIDPSDMEFLSESLTEDFINEQPGSSLDKIADEAKGSMGDRAGKTVLAVNINISKEMEGIHQLLNYFMDLFDNSYGSNREHLFGTEDLEMLMTLFKTTISDLTQGKVADTAISGKISSMQLLSASKLKDNLIRTKVNTDKLKNIYAQIQEGLNSMLAILSHKQLIAAENLGVAYRFYSASTYMQMKRILETIKPRIKQAEKMESELKKMSSRFDKIVVELGKQRQALLAFGDVVYTSEYQRKVAELFDASRYVSQTISLRLATLGLFIRQIKDIQESIYNVNAVNSRNKDFLTTRAFKL
jgi:hypothetical protein